LLIVGVGDSVTDLIHEHNSIERALAQVKMPRMNLAELRDIVSIGLAKLQMRIEPEALDMITRLSSGFPHWTHLLALTSARTALAAQRLTITQDDVLFALGNAMIETEQSVVEQYTRAVASQHKNTMHTKLLTACCVATSDSLGYFSAGDVRDALRRLTGREAKITDFAKTLKGFTLSNRGGVLENIGSARRLRYRFASPLVRVYAMLKAVDGKPLNPSAIPSAEPTDALSRAAQAF
jgi:hypothetical protein